MAIAAGAIFEVRSTGLDSSGGFFVPGTSGTIDYSQQNAPQLSVTDGVANGTTTITSVTGGFTAAMVNNGVNIAGVLYQITAYTNTNTITVDRTVATASALAVNVGGALVSLGMVGLVNPQGNFLIYLGPGTYSTSSTANVSGGYYNSTGQNGAIIGYISTRGDVTESNLVGRPVLSATGTNSQLVGNYNLAVTGVIFQGNSLTGIAPTNSSSNSQLYMCDILNCPGNSQSENYDFCFISNSGNLVGGAARRSVHVNPLSNSFYLAVASRCLAISTTGNGSGFQAQSLTQAFWDGCVAYGFSNAGGYGFFANYADAVIAENCVAYNNYRNIDIPPNGLQGAPRAISKTCASPSSTGAGFEI